MNTLTIATHDGWAEWLTAIGTLALAVATFTAVIVAVRQARKAEDKWEARRRAEQRCRPGGVWTRSRSSVPRGETFGAPSTSAICSSEASSWPGLMAPKRCARKLAQWDAGKTISTATSASQGATVAEDRRDPGAKRLLDPVVLDAAARASDGLDGRRLRKAVAAACALSPQAQGDPDKVSAADLTAALARMAGQL